MSALLRVAVALLALPLASAALPTAAERTYATSSAALARVIAAAGDRYTVRPVDVSRTTVRARRAGAASPAPTVLMHGLGDAGSNAGMQSLAQSVVAAHPGAYAVAVDVANTVQSFVTPIKLQIEELAAAIRADAKLAAAVDDIVQQRVQQAHHHGRAGLRTREKQLIGHAAEQWS
jgi:hypothetical protein